MEMKNGANIPQFQTLTTFMRNLMSLPHANVEVERIFSSVNFIKTQTRNRLQTKTVRALLKAEDGIKSLGGCVQFTPSADL